MTKKIIKLKDYYKDYELPDEFLKDKSIKNFLEISALNDINIFDKNKKKLKIKSKRKIRQVCEEKKKEKINEMTSINSENGNIKRFNIINKKNNKEIKNINSILNFIDKKETISYFNKVLKKQNFSNEEYIEEFTNDMELN
jgi:hypothetical protein